MRALGADSADDNERDAHPWSPHEFEEYCDAWAAITNPADELHNIVVTWFSTLAENPYHREAELITNEKIPPFWFIRVPNSHDGHGDVVTCTYWINELDHSVRCCNFTSMSDTPCSRQETGGDPLR